MIPYAVALLAFATTLIVGPDAYGWEDPKSDPFLTFQNDIHFDGMFFEGKLKRSASSPAPLVHGRLFAMIIAQDEDEFIAFANNSRTEPEKRAMMEPLLKALKDPEFQKRKQALGSDLQHADLEQLRRYYHVYAGLPLLTQDDQLRYRLIGYPKDKKIISLY